MKKYDWTGAFLILLPYLIGIALIFALIIAAWFAIPTPGEHP